MKLKFLFLFLFIANFCVAQERKTDSSICKQILKPINFEVGGQFDWIVPTVFVGAQIRVVKNIAVEASYGFLILPVAIFTSKKIGVVKYFYPKNDAAYFCKLLIQQTTIFDSPFYPKFEVGVNGAHFNLSVGIGYNNQSDKYFISEIPIKHLWLPSISIYYSNFLFKPLPTKGF